MGQHSVDIILQAHDQATAVFGKVETSMSSMAKKAAVIGATYFGARALIGFGVESVKEFAEYEKAYIKLAGGLQAITGAGMAGAQAARQQAQELQRLSGIEDNIILKSMALGASLGKLAGKDLLNATRAAIGWSTILDRDVNETMLMVTKAALGNITAFTRLGIKFDEGATAAADFNRILAEGEKGYAMTVAMADTTSRKLQDLGNSWKELKKTTGEALAPLAIPGMERTVKAIEKTRKGFDKELIFTHWKPFGWMAGNTNERLSKLGEDISILGKYTEETEIAKAASIKFDDILNKFSDDIYKLRYGEDELMKAQWRAAGASNEQTKALEWLQQRANGVAANKKATNELEKATADLNKELANTRKSFEFELATMKWSSEAKKLFELQMAGATTDELRQLATMARDLSILGTSKTGREFEPPPRWAPFESRHMVGFQSPDRATDYAAQTVKESIEHNRILRRVEEIQRRIYERLGMNSTEIFDMR